MQVKIPKNIVDLLYYLMENDPHFAEMVRQRIEIASLRALSILEAPMGSFPTQPPISQEPPGRP